MLIPTTSGTRAQPETVALFVSDIHLQPDMPRTARAFLDFLDNEGGRTRELYLLGDMFEYWAGDDDLVTPFNQNIADAIRSVSAHGVKVYWIAGNRDFLLSERFALAAGMTLLPDPFVIDAGGQRILISHGDAWCTDDLAYLAFRKTVRDPQWQAQFLAQSLEQRKEIIAGMRSGSRSAQRTKSMEIMDVNRDAIDTLLEQHGARVMVHGHTHRPALHMHEVGGTMRVRHVLPDWDCDTDPRRGGWLALGSDGRFTRHHIDEQNQ